MADRSTMLWAPHPTRGPLYAAVDPAMRFIEPKVCEMRFAALLAPFPDEESATAALADAVREGGDE